MLWKFKRIFGILAAVMIPLSILALPDQGRALAVGSSGVSSGASQGSSSSEKDEGDEGWPWTLPEDNDTDKFWAKILQKIRTADAGEIIEADARKTDYIVPRVITETQEYDVIVKVIFSSELTGEKTTVLLSRDTVKPVEAGVLYYPWKEFEKLYRGARTESSAASSAASSSGAAASLSSVSSAVPAGPASISSPVASSMEEDLPSQASEQNSGTPESVSASPAETDQGADQAQSYAGESGEPVEAGGGILPVGQVLAIGGLLSLTVLVTGLLGGRIRGRSPR